MIKLIRTVLLLDNFHYSYWVIVKTFGVNVELFTFYLLYCDRYDFIDEIVYFPINCLS